MANYINQKRLGEDDELGGSKYLKSELDDEKDDRYNEENRRNDKQDDMRSREEEEENHFLQLFTYVLNAIINMKHLKEDDIYESIELIKNSWTGGDPFHTIDFTQWNNICGYIFRFASHGAGFARFRMLDAIKNCSSLEKVLKKTDLKIISLGSGPGNDVVGFCSALSEVQYPKTLKITAVDKFNEWSSCINLIKDVLTTKEDNYGKISELFQKTKVELLFIQADLPGNSEKDEKYFEMLREADIIVMSKLISSLASTDIETAIMKSLLEHMKEDAVVLLNDFIFKTRWRPFNCVYRSGDGDEYLSIRPAEKRFNSYECTSSKLPINVLVKKKVKSIKKK